MRRLMATLAALGCVLALAACGEDEPDQTGTDEPVSIELTLEGGRVTPNGERVEVPAGQPVELVVKSDQAGEIHVHSDPEQSLEIQPGTSTYEIDPIDKPGVVEVELHEPALMLVQLEVS
ncbi:hypothetical protein [Nocardioides ferulae]|uniref:hypothetical protein n=1 Tax=Nocardioides ferulae TaxID=2340821 RepID=UPI000EAFC5C4|nr:hypothetical protein [Nocardioides ferulae]